MERIGIRELRQNASKYIERVKSGETIEVTQRGVPVAMLAPARMPSHYDRLVAEGRLLPARDDLTGWLEANPGLPSPPGISASEALREQREERL
jgi:prevent-host-death family protein